MFKEHRTWGLFSVISNDLQDIPIHIYLGHDFDLSGHETSPVTWPFDLPYAVSCWCPIGTESLSLAVFEVFSLQNPCAHADARCKWLYIIHAIHCIGQTKNYGFKLTHYRN